MGEGIDICSALQKTRLLNETLESRLTDLVIGKHEVIDYANNFRGT